MEKLEGIVAKLLKQARKYGEINSYISTKTTKDEFDSIAFRLANKLNKGNIPKEQYDKEMRRLLRAYKN